MASLALRGRTRTQPHYIAPNLIEDPAGDIPAGSVTPGTVTVADIERYGLPRHVFCKDCGQELHPVIDQAGMPVTVRDQVLMALRLAGRYLCSACLSTIVIPSPTLTPPDPLTCADCGKRIHGHHTKTLRRTASDVAAHTLRLYGRRLCWDCGLWAGEDRRVAAVRIRTTAGRSQLA